MSITFPEYKHLPSCSCHNRNSDEEKKRIQDEQKKNDTELKKIIEKVESEYGIKITDTHFRNHKNLRMKLRLWHEQDGRCLYSGL